MPSALVPASAGMNDIVPLKLWGVRDEAQYLTSGGIHHLLDLFRIEHGSAAGLAATVIHEQCQRRVSGWKLVQLMDGKVWKALAV